MPLLDLQELENMTPLFRGKVGNMFARGLMHIFSIDKLNALYDRNAHIKGADFAHRILEDLGIEYDIYATKPEVFYQLEHLKSETPFITISNHPYGSIDGIILADFLGHIRTDYKIIVNKILSRIEPLSSHFITVTPIGNKRTSPTTDSVIGIKRVWEHLRSGGALGLFPSGAVSDLSLRDRHIRDRQWQEPIIRLIAKANVPIMPIRFFEGNSPLYYSLGLLDWRIRLLRLPAELFNKRGQTVHIGIGPIITPEEQTQYLAQHTIEEFGQMLRNRVYGMNC